MATEVKLVSASSSTATRVTAQVQQIIDQLRERWSFDVLSATPTIASNGTNYVLVVALTVDIELSTGELAAFRAFTGHDESAPGAPAAGGQRSGDLIR